MLSHPRVLQYIIKPKIIIDFDKKIVHLTKLQFLKNS